MNDRERAALRDAKCPRCGESDLIRFTILTRLLDCKKCRHVWRIKV